MQEESRKQKLIRIISTFATRSHDVLIMAAASQLIRVLEGMNDKDVEKVVDEIKAKEPEIRTVLKRLKEGNYYSEQELARVGFGDKEKQTLMKNQKLIHLWLRKKAYEKLIALLETLVSV